MGGFVVTAEDKRQEVDPGAYITFPIHHGISLSLQDMSAQGAGGSGDTN